MAGGQSFSGVGHLTPEVVAALVDGELGRGAEHRAKVHLVHCQECRNEVRAQRQAAERLRSSDHLDGVHISGNLMDRLTQIPTVVSEDDTCSGAAKGEPTGHDPVGPDGYRRPETFTGRMAAAARRVQRKSGSGQFKSLKRWRGR